MPLSDREREILDAVEASLVTDDPELVHNIRLHAALSRPRVVSAPEPTVVVLDREHTFSALALLVGGVIALVAGLPLHPSVSVMGFALMVVGASRMAAAVVDLEPYWRDLAENSDRGHATLIQRDHVD